MRGKRGQVWVETVIYTLIGLSIIGIVLSAALPKINERQDAITIEQSIDALRAIDEKVSEVKVAVGNRRIVDLDIKAGKLVIDSGNDEISWVLDSSFEYSELGADVSLGALNVTTVSGDPYEVELKLFYDLDIRFDSTTDGEKVLSSAPTPYRLVIENVGEEENRVVVNLLAS